MNVDVTFIDQHVGPYFSSAYSHNIVHRTDVDSAVTLPSRSGILSDRLYDLGDVLLTYDYGQTKTG